MFQFEVKKKKGKKITNTNSNANYTMSAYSDVFRNILGYYLLQFYYMHLCIRFAIPLLKHCDHIMFETFDSSSTVIMHSFFLV